VATYTGSSGRTFEIACPDGAPEVGAWHDLNGYKFRETLHGPMVLGTCVGCGKSVAEAQPTGQATDMVTPESRCDACGRAHHGAWLDVYKTGRADLYRKVAPFQPHRRDPEYGGFVTLKDFLDEIDDQRLPPHERPTRCALCAAVIDPAARTVECPDRHMSCVRGWRREPESTPTQTALLPEEGTS
jgi:hypothetical protein